MNVVEDIRSAVSIAREFLIKEAGLSDLWLYLEEAGLEDDVWEIKFRYEDPFAEGYYVVKVNKKTGKIVYFRRLKKKEEE